MSFRPRVLGRVLVLALLAPVLGVAAHPATAATGLSGLVIDSIWTDGTGLSQSSSRLSPGYSLSAVPWGVGWKLQPVSTSTGSPVAPYVIVQPPVGGTLTAGQTYPLATSRDATHAAVYLYSSSSSGSSCSSTITGGLSVAEAVPDGAGTGFAQLALSFHEQCGTAPVEVYGEARVGSSTDVTSSFASPRGFVFSPLPAGTSAPVKTFTLAPNGSTPVTFGQAVVGGANPDDFALGSDTCSGATLPLGGSCTLTVTATPQSGARSATVTLPDGSARGARVLTLQATGQTVPSPPQGVATRTASDGVAVTWSAPLSWGNAAPVSYQVLRGTSPDAMTVLGTVATGGLDGTYADRVGDGTQVATTYYYAVRATNTIGSSDAGDTVSGATPAAVVVPSSRRVLTAEGDASSYVATRQGVLWASTPDKPDNVSASGCAALCITANETGLPYGYLSLFPPTGTLFAAGSYALAGNADATHAGGSLGVGGAGTQTWSGTLTVSRADVDSAGKLVAFSGEIAMTDLHLSVRLGTEDPVTFVSVAPVDAGTGVVGSTATAAATVSNVGDTPVTVSGATTAPSPYVADDWSVTGPDTCSGSPLAPGASCTIGVAVTPTGAGTRTADLVISDDTPLGHHDRALTFNALGAPDVPQALSATRAADGKVTVSWFDPGFAEKAPASFVVSVGASPSTRTQLGTVQASGYGTYSLTDPSVADSTRYYEVHATNAAGDSPQATLTVDAHHYAPTGLQVNAVVGRATLTWTPPTGYPAGPVTYDVYKGGSTTTLVKAASTQANQVTFTGLAPGSTVYLAVVARTALASSPRSSLVSFTVPTSQLVLANVDGYGSYWLTRAPVVPSTATVPLPRPDWSVGSDAYDSEVSPNGTTVAFAVGPASERIFTQRTDGTGYVLQVSDGAHDDDEPSWSPDGTRLSFTRWSADHLSSSLMTVPAAGGTSVAVPNSADLSASSWVGPRTLVAEDDSSVTAGLVLIDTATGARRAVPSTAGGYAPVARPDGSEVAFLLPGTGDADQLYVVNVATGVRRPVAVPDNAGLGRPSWSRNQATLYVPAFTYAQGSEVWSAAASGSGSAVPLTSNNGYVASVSVSTPDTTPPSVAVAALPTLSLSGSVRVAYSATDALNGIRRYDVRYTRQTATAAYAALVATGAGTTATSLTLKLAAGSTYCFSVRAADRAGNTSAWSAARCTTAPLDDRSLSRYSFSAVTGSAYYLGTAATTTSYHATLATSLTRRPLYVVAMTCPTCGSIEVRKGTTRVAVISLVSSSTVYRRVFALPVTTAGGGVSIRTTTTGKRVTVDGIVLAHV